MVELFSIKILFFLLCSLSSTISLGEEPHLCHESQALLKLKHSLTIHKHVSTSYCQNDDHINSNKSSILKTNSWNRSIDCCKWHGVTCDKFPGDVTELDLSCGHLSGIIYSNSSIFQLSHLKRLNLAFNKFKGSPFSPKFGRFSILTHLNLSNTGFSGKVPPEISQLTKLVSLDLSSYHSELDGDLSIGPLFSLQNLTSLRELVLRKVHFSSSSSADVFLKNLSSFLTILDLSSTSLRGRVPDDIFHLPNLHQLYLFENPLLIGTLTSKKWNSSTSLQILHLSSTGFSGTLPESIGYLQKLTSLDISSCNFMGSLPSSIGNLTRIDYLDLGENDFSGQLPSSISDLEQLTHFELVHNKLEGHLHFNYPNKLRFIDFSYNNFYDVFPYALTNATQLEVIEFSFNSLIGPLPILSKEFQHLVYLNLGDNSFSGMIPSKLFTLPSLKWLFPPYNRLQGHIPHFQVASSLLDIDLSHNQLHGPIPKSLSILVGLHGLDLSYNNLSGELDFSSMPKDIKNLILSHNNFRGEVRYWGALQNIFGLDLRSNLLEGPLDFPPQFIESFMISNNQLSGEISPSICKLSYLVNLDVSNNNLTGEIQECLGNLSKSINVLDMHKNKLQGTISTNIANVNRLTSLNLGGNRFVGKIPRSLEMSRNLVVLDLGDNSLIDTFPEWLGALPKLRILSLRSNKLYGHVNLYKPESFLKLQILNLSRNKLSGSLPANLFESFKGMMRLHESSSISYFASFLHEDSMIMVSKGVETEFQSILRSLTMIDLSENNFHGNVPASITRLASLRQLNLSHNRFAGQIPQIGNISKLESLDLSSNQLRGKIPEQLAKLEFLEVMNLSFNHLTGRIPDGRQLRTFPNDSYLGNEGLCGFPLSTRCGDDSQTTPPAPHHRPSNREDHSVFDSGFGWQSVLTGYGAGIVIGLVNGCLLMFFFGLVNLEVKAERILKKWSIKKRNMNRNGTRLHPV